MKYLFNKIIINIIAFINYLEFKRRKGHLIINASTLVYNPINSIITKTINGFELKAKLMTSLPYIEPGQTYDRKYNIMFKVISCNDKNIINITFSEYKDILGY